MQPKTPTGSRQVMYFKPQLDLQQAILMDSFNSREYLKSITGRSKILK